MPRKEHRVDPSNEDTIEEVLAHCDHAIQYGEDAEPIEPRDMDDDPDADYGGGGGDGDEWGFM